MGRPLPPLAVGSVFGRLVTTALPFNSSAKHKSVAVKCECGTEKTVSVDGLRGGRINSCGCLNKEVAKARFTTHGKRGDPIYPVWNMMVQRCTNPDYKLFADYGGRGITVCPEWLTFEGFYADMGDPPFEKAQLDRIDNEKGYYKENVRWTTRTQNNRNRRNTVKVFWEGAEVTLADLCEQKGLNYSKVYQRLNTYNWPLEKAITHP